MPRPERQELLRSIQTARGGRLLISYVTSTRPGFEVSIADDVVEVFHEHLEKGKVAADRGVDLFIHSNGGSGTVPWRLVSLIRQYTKKFAVLVPHHAFSAATLIALGADEIIMHKMGCLGPIDPSVQNIFNPQNPLNPGQLAPISVEDVSAYFKLVKDEVGITHEDELVQTLLSLTEKVHPLALGNVQRSHNQSRMIAKKLLHLHIGTENDHDIQQLIDNLKSNLFYHGHPINRLEARNDLKLKVTDADPGVEDMMWRLYSDYADQMRLREPFNPVRELELAAAQNQPAAAPPMTVQSIAQILIQLSQNGIAFPNLPAAELVNIAAAMAPHLLPAPNAGNLNRVVLQGLLGVYVESEDLTKVFKTDMRLERAKMMLPSGPQDVVKHEVLWQRWENET
jgi:hypothetical protein